MADPNERDREFSGSTLKFSDLGSCEERMFDNLTSEWEPLVRKLRLPHEFDTPPTSDHPSAYRYVKISKPTLLFIAWVGAGIMLLHAVRRTEGPHLSEVAQAFYEKYYDMSDLKYIVLNDVMNLETSHLVKSKLYSELNGLQWPDEEPMFWTLGTPEFDGLLGTRMGKLVAYIVLGAFPQGNRQIDRIVTWPGALGIHMRFDIGVVE